MTNGMIECSVCHSKLLSTKAISRAYDRHRSKVSKKHRALNVLLVVGDCMLIGLQPILVYMSKVDGKFKFSPISVNFLTEIAKVIFALIMLLIQARNQNVGEPPLLSFSTFLQAARNNMILAVPALLYAINNYLKFIMQLYFNPATVKMLSNLKVLVIAILLRIIMKRRFSIIQWEALALLLIGISITQMQALPKDSSGIGVPVAMGAYIYTFVFVTVPSLASVFNEYALKSQYDTSIYLQNLFLYGYGAIFNFLGILGTVVLKGPESFDILRGHSKATMLLIINNAGQGILSSFFFKYADTILKKYSSTVATIFTGFASAALFGHTLTINFMLGISIVFISMHQLSASGGRGGPGHWHNPFQYLGDIFWFGPFACNFTGKDIKVEVVFLLEQNQRRRRCKGAGMTFSQTGPFRIQVTCTQCGGSGKYVKSLCKSCNGQRVVRGPKSMKLNIMPDILWSGYE